jgi:Fe-S cluster assembly ATPase SufC
MRNADILKYWERVNKLNLYKNIVQRIRFSGVEGLKDNFEVEFKSTIHAICGKNGVGKSSFLKSLYRVLSGNIIEEDKRFDNVQYEVEGKLGSQNVLFTHADTHFYTNVYYLESSKLCSEILTFLKTTENIEELKDGIEINQIFNGDKTKEIIEQIIGKKYKSIDIYEISSVLGDDTVFPFFEIEDSYGVKYSNLGMGMGEFHCLYITWYLNWVENDSLVLIEEPENFISVYSQEYLIHYIAKIAADNKLWSVISTHSYQILSSIGFNNATIISRATSKSSIPLANRHKNSYLRALGLNPTFKGAIFVEDYCAAVFTKFLIRKYYPELLFDFQIVELRCDSNLEKIIKHFEPNINIDYEFIVVFDADQSSKLKSLFNKNIYFTALPANSPEPPEKVIYDTLTSKIDLISERLDVSGEYLADIIDQYSSLEYHEIYRNIAAGISVDLRQIYDSILNVWLTEESNEDKAKFFVSSLVNRNNKIECNYEDQTVNFEKGILQGISYSKSFPLTECLVSISFDGINSFVNDKQLN